MSNPNPVNMAASVEAKLKNITAERTGDANAELHDQLEPDTVGEMMKRRNINIGDLWA